MTSDEAACIAWLMRRQHGEHSEEYQRALAEYELRKQHAENQRLRRALKRDEP